MAKFNLPFTKHFRVLKTIEKQPFGNIVGKRERTGILMQYFPILLKCFLFY